MVGIFQILHDWIIFFKIYTIELDAYIHIFKTKLIEIFNFSKQKILIITIFLKKNELLFESN
jgi:hypothetical protein